MAVNEILSSLQIGFPILSGLILLPLLGIVIIAASASSIVAIRTTITVATAELLLTLVMISAYRPGTANLQFVETGVGIYRLGIDGISALFLPLTAVLTLLCSLSSEAGVQQGLRGYMIALLALCATMMGAFAAADAYLFWLFLTLEVVPAYFLIAHHGVGEGRHAAARHYGAVMLVSAALMLIGIEFLVGMSSGKSDLKSLMAAHPPAASQTAVFALLGVALAIRTPVFPLHSWLPRVLEQGPVVGIGVFLVGIKVGAYGFLRFVITMLPDASAKFFWVVAALAVIGMVYGGLIALAQTNLRRLLAYASISHMGVVLLGLFSLNSYGLRGGVLQMLSIGMAVAGLYFISGFLYTRVGAPSVANLGGLVERAPVMSLAFIVTAMAAIGMPGTSGFNGEHLVIIGAYKLHWAMALFVGLGNMLTAAYLLRFFQRSFMASAAAGSRAHIPDLDVKERIVAGTLVTLVLSIGLYTSPFLVIVDGSLNAVAEMLETRRGIQVEPPTQAHTLDLAPEGR